MAPPSSGGSTVGESLNILEGSDLGALDRTEALHRYLESTALAFADRNRYVGDADFVDVPLQELLSQGFADERACLIGTTAADQAGAARRPGRHVRPVRRRRRAATVGTDGEGLSTTHLTTWDRWGNVVAYTLTIEQTGGSGIVVPGRGFLLNNELTDFNFTPTQGTAPDPNLPAPGKRPRSSMSPTIVLDDGEPILAVGSPGGSMIITTVLQTLLNRLDFGATLPEAVAAPRASQRNTAAVSAEPAFIAAWAPALAGPRPHLRQHARDRRSDRDRTHGRRTAARGRGAGAARRRRRRRGQARALTGAHQPTTRFNRAHQTVIEIVSDAACRAH